MPRGGGSAGRGGKSGPDMSWDDEESTVPSTLDKNIPGPLFPPRTLRTPKPMTQTETTQIKSFLRLRDKIRTGPYTTTLEPSSLLNPTTGKSNPRAGFDPFNDQERFTNKFVRKKRAIPNLAQRGGYTLKLFPVELWAVLDPKRKQVEYWDRLSEDVKNRVFGGSNASKSSNKRKRKELKFDEDDDDLDDRLRKRRLGSDDLSLSDRDNDVDEEDDDDDDDDEDEDDEEINSGRRRKTKSSRRRRNKDQPKTLDNETRTSKRDPGAKSKKGLDAEDDYPDADQNENNNNNNNNDDGEDGTGGGANGQEEDGGEEPVDSEFDTDEDGDDGMDDYNAEQYFDDGENDDFGGGGDGDGGDDDGGGGGGGGYY